MVAPVAVVSLTGAVASLIGSTYLAVCVRPRCVATSKALQTTDSESTVRARENVRAMLFAIAVADVLGSACWVSTQVQVLSGCSIPGLAWCYILGFAGPFAFALMSIWTTMLAVYLHGVLTSTRSRGWLDTWLAHAVGWCAAALVGVLTAPGHAAICEGGCHCDCGAEVHDDDLCQQQYSSHRHSQL